MVIDPYYIDEDTSEKQDLKKDDCDTCPKYECDVCGQRATLKQTYEDGSIGYRCQDHKFSILNHPNVMKWTKTQIEELD